MEEQGADPDAVARFLAESLGDDDEPEFDAPVEIWPENEEAFAVFTHCRWSRTALSTMETATMIYDGISSSEIQDVCNLLGIEQERRPGVLGLVRVMEAAALPLLNARNG